MIKYIQSYDYKPEHKIYYDQIIPLTRTIAETYPAHINWVDNKFIGGLKTSLERAYSFAVDKDVLAGCSLLKNTPEEKKICCLFVDPLYRGQGIASQLIENSFELLQTLHPVMTVSNNNINQLIKLINRYNFELTRTVKGAYRPDLVEYYYNEHYQKIR